MDKMAPYNICYIAHLVIALILLGFQHERYNEAAVYFNDSAIVVLVSPCLHNHLPTFCDSGVGVSMYTQPSPTFCDCVVICYTLPSPHCLVLVVTRLSFSCYMPHSLVL